LQALAELCLVWAWLFSQEWTFIGVGVHLVWQARVMLVLAWMWLTWAWQAWAAKAVSDSRKRKKQKINVDASRT
jgi:hypothetical protein